MFKIFCYSVVSVPMSYQYMYISRATKNTEIVFLSHATEGNINSSTNDQYFALMPEYVALKNTKVTILYSNHKRIGYVKNYKKLVEKNPNTNVFLMPKFLRPRENIRYFVTVLTLSIKSMRLGLKRIFKSNYDARLLINASPYFLSRETYNNYLLKNRLNELQKKSSARKFVFTLEGYSYEQYAVDSLNKIDQSIRFIFYQHSPLVSGHVGIKHFVKQINFPVDILVSAKIYKEYLYEISSIPRYFLIGSQKFSPKISNFNEERKSSCLFAPEGTVFATLDFINLIYYLLKNKTSNSLILRLHPNLRSNLRLKRSIKKLKTYDNFHISKDDLQLDLEKSLYVLYRSSAVGVEALRYSAIPIFYGKSEERDLDPLNLVVENQFAAYSSTQVLNLLNSLNKVDGSAEIRSQHVQYFSEMRYIELDKIILT